MQESSYHLQRYITSTSSGWTRNSLWHCHLKERLTSGQASCLNSTVLGHYKDCKTFHHSLKARCDLRQSLSKEEATCKSSWWVAAVTDAANCGAHKRTNGSNLRSCPSDTRSHRLSLWTIVIKQCSLSRKTVKWQSWVQFYILKTVSGHFKHRKMLVWWTKR